MLSSKLVSVKNSPSYRHCRPARVSSKQDSGRAGPEKSLLYKHKRRVYLICLNRAIRCYLVIAHLAIGSVDQLRCVANRTLAERDLRRVCCINTKVGSSRYAHTERLYAI